MAKKQLTTEDVTLTNTEDKTIKELQELINDLKQRNIKLEEEKATLFAQTQQIKEVEKIVEKIVEIPVEKIVEKTVEKIVEVKINDTNIGYIFKPHDLVYYPEKYQRMEFEVRNLMGQSHGTPLYRIYNHERDIEETYVPEHSLRKF